MNPNTSLTDSDRFVSDWLVSRIEALPDDVHERLTERLAIQAEGSEIPSVEFSTNGEYGRGWDDYSQEERAIFTTVLRQKHKGLDDAIKQRDIGWVIDGQLHDELPAPHTFRKVAQ